MIPEPYTYFPALNATLNGTSVALLIIGRILIWKGRIAAHRACMLLAVSASALFLAGYLFFPFKVGNILFLGPGWARPVYFTILISHVTLAIVIVPMAIVTLNRGLKRRFDKAPGDRPLDLAARDLRVSYRGGGLFHALPVVSAQLNQKVQRGRQEGRKPRTLCLC
jgi:putative membrane protein